MFDARESSLRHATRRCLLNQPLQLYYLGEIALVGSGGRIRALALPEQLNITLPKDYSNTPVSQLLAETGAAGANIVPATRSLL